jgi:hypothetical protein
MSYMIGTWTVDPEGTSPGPGYSLGRFGVWQRFVSEKDTSLKPFRCNHFRGHFFNFLHLA